MHGDNAKLLKSIRDNYIDLTVTSPPYDDLRDYKGFNFDFENVAKELYRVTNIGGVVVWVVNDQTKNFCESLTSFKQATYFVETCGFNLLDTMIYDKINSPPTYPGMRRYIPLFEFMFVFSKGKPKTFNPIKDIPNKSFGRTTVGSQRQRNGDLISFDTIAIKEFGLRSNVWLYDNRNGSSDKITTLHPATFPEKLAKDHILSWSNPNDIVLDPMMGSGTTGKMALLNNRKFIGMECSVEYVNIAVQRIEKTLGVINASNE